MVTDYTKRVKKLAAQSRIFPLIKEKNFVGLCGPNVIEYLEKIDYKRYQKVILVEYDRKVYDKIKHLVIHIPNVRLLCDNVGNHLHYKNTFYDLDFCATIKQIRDLLPKIGKLKEFSITLCVRKFSYTTTETLLAFYLQHQKYAHIPYKDGAPMVTFLISHKKFK